MFYFFNNKNELPRRSLEEIKQICNIIFIDDIKFEVVDILKTAGWRNVKRIKDVESLDEKDIVDAHILFVDVNGVGKKLKFIDEGLGLITALKDKYPNKFVIVYSADSTGDRFHEGLSKADARLKKNAEPYQFQKLTEDFSKEAFSLEECIERIRKVLTQELGYTVETDDIIKKVRKIHGNKHLTITYVEKIFNTKNALLILEIIKLFLKNNGTTPTE